MESPEAFFVGDNAPPKKKRKKPFSPTAHTLKECRKRGWIAQVVEQTVPHCFIKRDLFGVIDIVAIVLTRPGMAVDWDAAAWYNANGNRGALIAIQATSGANHASRRAKILAEPRARMWLETGNRLELWSWSLKGKAGKRKLYQLRVEAFTTADFEAKEAA